MLSGQRKKRLASSMDTSTRWPAPVRPRATRAEQMACAAVMDVTLSQSSVFIITGRSLAGSACSAATPEIA